MTTELRPHQQQLLDTFINSPKPSTLIAQWPLGSGIHLTAAKLAEVTFTANPSARVLFLCDHITAQTAAHETLQRYGVQAEQVPPSAFRARNDQVGARPLAVWEPGKAFVLTIEALDQDLLSASLAAVEWATIIVLGVHRSTRIEAHLTKVLAASPDCRLVVFARTPMEVPDLTSQPVTLLTVTFNDVVRAEKSDSQHFDFLPVETYPTPEEMDLGKDLKTLFGDLQLTMSHKMAHEALAQACQSSSAALERYLQRLKKSLDNLSEAQPSPLFVAEKSSSIYGRHNASSNISDPALNAQVAHVLHSLSALADDSKIKALQELHAQKQPGRSEATCIITYQRSTIPYIKEALELPSYGSDPLDYRSLTSFIEHGGTLVTTIEALQGLELRANKVILFDLPDTIEKIYATLVRFRAKDQQRLPVHLFWSDARYGPTMPQRFTLTEVKDLF